MRKRLSERQSKQAAAGIRREISNDFKYDKKKLKHLFKILHNVNVALGTLGSALNEFTKIKGPAISPDGLLGGLGYIMPIKGIKEALTTSVHSLGEVADSIADELTNPHWKAEDDKETKELIKEKEKVEEETQKALEPEGEEPNESEAVPEDGESEKQEPQPEKDPEEEGIKPEEVVTSKSVYASEKGLSEAVKKALVKFSSVGTFNSK